MAHMTVGPAVQLAGNQVQLTDNGKFRITNSEGKVKTLSSNQFKKQILKNYDKIAAGDEVEFKDNKKGIIAASAAGAAIIGTLAALGIAQKKGKLQIKNIAKNDVILKRAAKKINNAAEFVGSKVNKYSSQFVDWVKKFVPEAKVAKTKTKKATAPKAPKAPKKA